MNDKIKLMYVDDEELNLKLFELNFNEKYDIFTAESGEKALDLLEKHGDTLVVISDMQMPGMTGVEFVKRAKLRYPNINFYILTGFEINDDIQQAISSKIIKNQFNKPSNFEEIDAAIMSALKQ